MEDISQPWSVFKIAPQCPQQRFRLVSALTRKPFFSPKDQFLSLQVSALTSHCPVIISVEGHKMTVVASDGQEVGPEVVCFHPFLNHFFIRFFRW